MLKVIDPILVLLHMSIDNLEDVPDLVLDVITRHQPLSDYNIRMIAPLFPATTIDYWVNLRDTYNKQCNANLGSKGLSPKYFVAKFVDNTDVMLESASKSICACSRIC